MNKEQAKKTKSLVEVALFVAIIFVLAFTPFVGYIPIGAIKATTVHIPVIIGAIILGKKKGAFLGFIFGLTSFIGATFVSPEPTSFLFSPIMGGNIFSLIICFVPRILIGVDAYLVYAGIKKLLPKCESLAIALGAIAGSLTNTILVMGLIYVCFAQQYAAVRKVAAELIFGVILSTVFVNGIPEAIVAAIISTAICKALLAFRKHQRA